MLMTVATASPTWPQVTALAGRAGRVASLAPGGRALVLPEGGGEPAEVQVSSVSVPARKTLKN